MAHLPKNRMDLNQPPFTNTGVDFFGPLVIKQGRKRIKRWVSLFTCMTVTCVHLEVVESLETDGFINALQRFISRRQKPKQLHSDCRTNFKGAAKELKETFKGLNQTKLANFAHQRKLRFGSFNTKPLFGGIKQQQHIGKSKQRTNRNNTQKTLEAHSNLLGAFLE